MVVKCEDYVIDEIGFWQGRTFGPSANAETEQWYYSLKKAPGIACFLVPSYDFGPFQDFGLHKRRQEFFEFTRHLLQIILHCSILIDDMHV